MTAVVIRSALGCILALVRSGIRRGNWVQNRLQEISVILERCEYARCTVYKDKTTDSGTDGGKAAGEPAPIRTVTERD